MLIRDMKIGSSMSWGGVRIRFEAKKGQLVKVRIDAPKDVRVMFHPVDEGHGEPSPAPLPVCPLANVAS